MEVQVLPGAPFLFARSRHANPARMLASPSGQGIGPTHRHTQVRVLERAPPSRLPGTSLKPHAPPTGVIRPASARQGVRTLTQTIFSRSSKAERPADNRKTAVRYRAGEPKIDQQESHHDNQRNGAACRRIFTSVDPERSSLRRLGSGLLIRAPEVQVLPGPPTAISHAHD